MMRTLILTLVGCTALIAAAGCSAEVPADDEAVQASVGEGSTVEPNGVWTTCAGSTTAMHHKATELVRYVYGAAAPTVPAGAACDQVMAALTDLRNGLNDGTPMNVYHTSYAICGINSSVVVFAQSATRPLVKSVIERLEANTEACFGQGMRPFLYPVTSMSSYDNQLWMDPEPATLTADLSSTQGAAAAAYYSASLDPTVAKKWNATYGACGSAVAAAEPCSTTALSSGQEATRMIQKNGTLCRCL